MGVFGLIVSRIDTFKDTDQSFVCLYGFEGYIASASKALI